MMRAIGWAALAALAGLVPLAARAETDEALARAALARLAPAAELQSVRPAPLPGFLELMVSGEVMYLSRDGRHLLQGNLFDTLEAANLSERSREDQRAARIAALDEAARIRFEAGKPAHRITVFTALDCGYCRRLHADIDAYLEAGISIDYVLIPFGADGSESDSASRGIHCAANRQDALTVAMRGEPAAAAMCPAPGYAAGKALAQALGINRTPTLIAPGGEQLRYSTPQELRSSLDALVAAR